MNCYFFRAGLYCFVFISCLALMFASCRHTGPIPATPDNADCDTAGVSFRRHVEPILEQYCYSCHKGVLASGDIFLDTYDKVMITVADGSLRGAILHLPGFEPMPEAGAELPECYTARIIAWINAGSPDN